MEYLISAVIGYILGSIPTAYLILKKYKGIDITQNGSSNVGALNSIQVSKSKAIGATVLVIDLLKGLVSVIIVKAIFGDVFIYPMTALFFAVLAHCYSPWLKFKGGRGLATAAGGALVLSIPVLIVWIVIWVLGYLFRKNVHFGNIAATILTAAVVISTSDIINKYSNPPADNHMVLGVLVTLMMLVIFTRHIKPLKEYIKEQNTRIRK
jgi:glycerol-3-phosphate acyltransferase PlsY